MASYSCILDWKIPWIEEPGGLMFMGSQRIRHNWSHLAPTSVKRGQDTDKKVIIGLAKKISLKTRSRTFTCGYMLSCVSHVWLCVTQWTIACQAPLLMRFSRQKYWSGLPCPSPGDLPNWGIKPTSPMFPVLAGRFFTTSTTWVWLNSPTTEHIPYGNHNLKRLLNTNVHCGTIYNS